MKVFLRKKKIQEILLRKSKAQNWLACRMEISSGYMSQLMDGSRCPSPRLRERILGTLEDYTFDDLFQIRK